MKNNSKKKWSFKRVKRIFKNVMKELVNSFKSIVDKFSKLPKHIKMICGVWLIVVLLIIVIVLASTNNKKYLDEYYYIEDVVSNATLSYVKKKKIYPVKDSKLKLSIDELNEFGMLSDGELEDKKCQGFSLSYYDEEMDDYVIKSYINCDKYMTKNYSDYK